MCTVSIPIDTADNLTSEILSAVDKATTETAGTTQGARGEIRILVADDHEVARQAMVQTLSLAEGFDVIGEAVDGLDAIQKTRTLRPDVVLMDVTMPQLSGIDATHAIMSELSGVKVIGLSMHSSEEMESRMLAAGAISYLQKLVTVEKLFATIRSAMNKEGAEAIDLWSR